MNKEIIKNALENAYCLISEEYQSVIIADLHDEYESTMEEINDALNKMTSKKLTEMALKSSHRLISEEYQTVIIKDLKEEYERVIQQIDIALKELKK